MPLVSVLLATRNNLATLPAALRPFLSEPAVLEILLVNDGSTDGTREYLDGIRAAHPDRVRPIHLEHGIGLTKALNLALRESRGEYLARQDADDVSHEDRIRRQLEAFRADPGLDFLGTGHRIVDSEGKALVSIEGKNFGNLGRRLLKGNVFCHGSMMMKRSSLLSLGGYREFYKYAQDYDLFLRAAKAGMKLANLEECLYDWTFSEASISATKAAEQEWCMRHALWSHLGRAGKEPDPPAADAVRAPGAHIPRELQLLQFFLLGCETRAARRQLGLLRSKRQRIAKAWKYALLCLPPPWLYRVMRRVANLRYA
jgi:glycosyltransferase involved in cell wall biosynthesis